MGRTLETGSLSVLTTMLLLNPFPALADDVPARATGHGMIAVTVKQNGAAASGSFEVRRPAGSNPDEPGAVVASGRSGQPLQVAAGAYDVVIRLAGAIDRPERWIRGVRVAPGRTVAHEESFATAVLEVRVVARGRRAAATIYLRRPGEPTDLATLGAGVRAVLSAGTYDIVVRHRSEERSFPGTVLSAGGSRTLTVTF